MAYECYWIYCPDCDVTLVFESRLESNGRGYERIVCPQCSEELAVVRSDDGCECIGLVCGYLQPDLPCWGGTC